MGRKRTDPRPIDIGLRTRDFLAKHTLSSPLLWASKRRSGFALSQVCHRWDSLTQIMVQTVPARVGKLMSGPPYHYSTGLFNSCHSEKHGLKILSRPCFLVYFRRPCPRSPAWHCAHLTLEVFCLHRHVNLRLPAGDKEKEILIWASLGTCPHSLSSASPLLHPNVPFSSRITGQELGWRIKDRSGDLKTYNIIIQA